MSQNTFDVPLVVENNSKYGNTDVRSYIAVKASCFCYAALHALISFPVICKITMNFISVSHRVPCYFPQVTWVSESNSETHGKPSQPQREKLWLRASRLLLCKENKRGTSLRVTDIKHSLKFTSSVVHGRNQITCSLILWTIQTEMQFNSCISLNFTGDYTITFTSPFPNLKTKIK